MKLKPSSCAASRMAKLSRSSHWLPKTIVPRQRRLTLSPERPRLTKFKALSVLAGILIEALAGLAAEFAPVDLLLQEAARFRALAEAMPVGEHSVEDIDAREVEQLEWTHRPVQ